MNQVMLEKRPSAGSAAREVRSDPGSVREGWAPHAGSAGSATREVRSDRRGCPPAARLAAVSMRSPSTWYLSNQKSALPIRKLATSARP